MEWLKKNGTILCWFMTGLGIFLFLQIRYAFHFYFIEQNQLFLFNKHFVAELFLQPGGFAAIVEGFLIQFFIYPYAGAFILSLLLVVCGLLQRSVIRCIVLRGEPFLLYLAPVLLLFFLQCDIYYFLQGTIAYVMVLAATRLFFSIRAFRWKLLYTMAAIAVLAWTAGSVSVLFVAGLIVYILFTDYRCTPVYLLLLLFAACLMGGFVYMGLLRDFRTAFLPDMYYYAQERPSVLLYYLWLTLPVSLVISHVFARAFGNMSFKQSVYLSVARLLFVLFAGWLLFSAYGFAGQSRYKEYDYYARTEQWNQILRRSEGRIDDLLCLQHVNLALANQNELGRRLFCYDQKGADGLYVIWDRTIQKALFLSDFYFVTGNIAASQHMAFEGYVISKNGNPRLLKRLVQTNLILGNYPVAEKYAELLGQTWYYRAWADSQRVFLYNDQAIEEDPLLGNRRKSVLKKDYLYTSVGLDAELEDLAEAHPAYTVPIHSLGALYLLDKNLKRFETMLETYWDTAVLSDLPESFQEAVILLNEKDEELWRKYRVAEKTIRRFKEYRQFVLSNRTRPDLSELVHQLYGDTYWFYYMFT